MLVAPNAIPAAGRPDAPRALSPLVGGGIQGNAKGRRRAAAPRRQPSARQAPTGTTLPQPILELLTQHPLTRDQARLLAIALTDVDLRALAAGLPQEKESGNQQADRLASQWARLQAQRARSETAHESPEEAFARMDRDGDGLLNVLEIRDHLSVGVALFRALDLDANGSLDVVEYRKAAGPADSVAPEPGSKE